MLTLANLLLNCAQSVEHDEHFTTTTTKNTKRFMTHMAEHRPHTVGLGFLPCEATVCHAESLLIEPASRLKSTITLGLKHPICNSTSARSSDLYRRTIRRLYQ